MPRVPVTVKDEQKDRWAEFVDKDPRVDSMADLVRSSVEQFISADSTSESESLNDNDVDEIMDSLDQLDSDISKLTTEIKALRQENIESDEMEHLILLKTEEVVERIPEYAPELVDGDNH